MFEEVAETIDLEESLEEVERIFEEAPDICCGMSSPMGVDQLTVVEDDSR